MNKPNVIVAAANRSTHDMDFNFTAISARHFDEGMRAQIRCLRDVMKVDLSWSSWEQGFIDKFAVFHTREQAWLIAEAAGQIKYRVGGDMNEHGVGRLYSENLY